MNRIVVDVSVCLKWFLARGRKADRTAALDLMSQVNARKLHLVQPVTWRADVAAALVRKSPAAVKKGIDTLQGLKPRDGEGRQTLHLASELAVTLHTSLFVTLYHAVAIEKNIELVTADSAYFERAAHFGHIRTLRDWIVRSRIAERDRNFHRGHATGSRRTQKKR